jgi:gas vesicle protein
MGFILGLLAGAVAALLYAPKSGDITREELRMRTDELKRRADDLQRIAQKLADDASVKGRELIDEARRQWETTGPGASRGAASRDTTTGGGSAKQP